MPRDDNGSPGALTRRARHARWAGAFLLGLAGSSLIVFAQAWRGLETVLAGNSIEMLTRQATIAVQSRHMLILYKSTSVQSIFVLTPECSVAYLLAAFFVGSAPLLLLKKLSPWRTLAAVATTSAILMSVNIARLTAIGGTVSMFGRDPGLAIAHTYLGSLLTIVGTGVAGIAFAAVLVVRRTPRSPVMA